MRLDSEMRGRTVLCSRGAVPEVILPLQRTVVSVAVFRVSSINAGVGAAVSWGIANLLFKVSMFHLHGRPKTAPHQSVPFGLEPKVTCSPHSTAAAFKLQWSASQFTVISIYDPRIRPCNCESEHYVANGLGFPGRNESKASRTHSTRRAGVSTHPKTPDATFIWACLPNGASFPVGFGWLGFLRSVRTSAKSSCSPSR